MMQKIVTLDYLVKVLKEKRKLGKSVGLITGCFDILHRGHINLFRFGKKHTNILVVGVENDETIRLSKGEGRPINKQEKRLKNLGKVKGIDYVFPIDVISIFGRRDISKLYIPILKAIKPDYLITNPKADESWRQKEKVTKELSVGFLKQKGKEPISTTKIIKGKLKKAN